MNDRPGTIGFVGLGRMGAPMARNLCAAGYDVVGYDRSSAAADALAGVERFTPARSLHEVGHRSGLVITMLPTGAIVRDVVLGGGDADGDSLVAGGIEGGVIADMSSSAPRDTLGLAASLADLGVALVDAPVSGGVVRAAAGTLAVFAGGSAPDVDRVRPVLDAIGAQVFHAGPVGAGHAVKALNNLLSAAAFTATIEVLRVAEAYGVDAGTFTDIVNASSGSNNTTQNKLRQFVLSESYASGFALDLMAKDLRIAFELAHDNAVDLPVCAHVVDRWNKAAALLGPRADHTEYARLATSSTVDGEVGERAPGRADV